MSCSKFLPPFVCDSLYYLNRDQLERFSIVCRPLKNFIDRYFHSKPYCVFDRLWIRGGMYALEHNVQSKLVQWHPNRDDYSTQQFLAGQKCSIDKSKSSWADYEYYSFDEMRPYLGPTVRIKKTYICVSGYFTCNYEHIGQMESISYLWRDGDIDIRDSRYDVRISAEDFQPILNSSTILQCQELYMYNAHFAFKDYKVLCTVKVFEILYYDEDEEIDPDSWPQFLEKPGVKPIVVLRQLHRESVDNLLDRLFKDFSSAVSPNAFKIVFAELGDEILTEFREINKTSDEILELKKGMPAEYQKEHLKEYASYTLERSSI